MTPARLASYLRWQARLARQWWRGGDERHLALAHWRGDALRRRLARMARRARSEGRELVIVALVEHFGDVVAAEPIFRAVRRKHPQAVLVHVVGEKWRPLTSEHPGIDRQVGVGCLSEWYLASGRTGAVEYDLHVPGRVCDTCRSVTRPTPARTPGIDITSYYFHGSLLDVFAKVGGVDLEGVDRQPRLHVPGGLGSPADSTQRAGLGERYALIHAASNQRHRDWTVEGWQRVIAALRAEGLEVAEVGLTPTLAAAGAVDRTVRPLRTTIDVIRGASIFLGVDSGPAHVASALGTPAVVLLGHYGKYERRMPFSGRLAAGEVTSAELLSMAAEEAAGAGGGQRLEASATAGGGLVIQHDGPLAELPAEAVIAAARAVLRGGGGSRSPARAPEPTEEEVRRP